MDDDKKAVLEAALFVSEEPIGTDTIADILNLGSKGYVQMIVDELQEDMQQDHRGVELIETNDGYRMQVKNEHIDDVKDLAPHQDLADATLRTLSIIAYNAPVKQSKIIEIRGNRAYKQISELEDRNLLTSSKDGRTKILDVTEEFLDYFDIDSINEFKQELDAQPAADELLDKQDQNNAEESETSDEQTTTEQSKETDEDPSQDNNEEDVPDANEELLRSDGTMD